VKGATDSTVVIGGVLDHVPACFSIFILSHWDSVCFGVPVIALLVQCFVCQHFRDKFLE